MGGELILIFLAGIVAGVFTGFSGGSATNIFVPILVIFAGYSPYASVGVALAVDVISCLVAFYVYHKKEKINFKPFLPLLVFSLIGVYFGSFYSHYIPSQGLKILVGIGICFVSLKFFKKKKNPTNRKKKTNNLFGKYNILFSALLGLVLGIILGIFGGGGGLLLLLVLTLVLNYKTHEAIEASVLLMIFLALFGTIIHYVYMPFSLTIVLVGCLGGIIGARYSSVLANKLSEEKLNIIVGIFLFILGFALFLSGLI